MRRFFLFCCFIVISLFSISQGSEESKIFYRKAISEINPKHVQWIKSKAAEVDVSPEGIITMQAAAQDYLKASKLASVDPNALVQLVLRESYIQTTEDLRFYAEKVKYFNECKKVIRDYLQKLRDYDAKMRESARSQFDSIKSFSSSLKLDIAPPSNPNLNRSIIKKDSLKVQTIKPSNNQVAKPVSPDEISLLIKELERKDSLLDQNSQEASVRMQLLMDRARKADSIASNLFKKYAEDANAIIANLK
jgi:hypothetical protein